MYQPSHYIKFVAAAAAADDDDDDDNDITSV